MARLDWRKPTATGETPEDLLESLYYQGHTDGEGARFLSLILGRKIGKDAYKSKRQSLGLGKSAGGRVLVPASAMPRFDDPPRVEGDALRDTTRPAVVQGALIVKRGYPWLLSPKWTDWRALRTIKW